ncbi:transmembrane protein 202-like isoform X2 [Leopardus geoffroyi]|uniref:transmembrane protein 202-like isoform X2 n=1 Tax=Leopardus geoffroyi TaxID=46844 RepID=UPI001E2635F8|nr:transmembrane protein 202-like isoform X2 [Leopardus geoffroyi]
MAVEKSNEPETGMERREGNAMPLHRVYNSSILGYPTYRPILPYRMYHFSSMSPHQRQLLERTQSYIRMFCAGLMGFIFVLLMCLSPLHWVRFMVMKDKKKLFAGLWTVCHHDLCWSHVPKAPYYLQYSRAFFLISAFIILIIIIWLSTFLTKGTGDKTHIDLGMSIFSFISGFLSGLNHISSWATSPDQNLLVIPITRTRIGNRARVDGGLTETNVGVSTWMNQAPERRSGSVAQSSVYTEKGTQTKTVTQKVLESQVEPEVQAESGTHTEPEIGSESAIKDGLITTRLATEIEPIDTVQPRPEAEIIGSVADDMSSNSLQGNENKMTKNWNYEDRDSAEKNEDDKTKN